MSLPVEHGRLLTTRQVADYLGVSPETVLRRWRSGDLPGYRLATNALRFSETDVDGFLASRRSGPDTRHLAVHPD